MAGMSSTEPPAPVPGIAPSPLLAARCALFACALFCPRYNAQLYDIYSSAHVDSVLMSALFVSFHAQPHAAIFMPAQASKMVEVLRGTSVEREV